MTAEFNITIPGAEVIKRLADLETQVRDLANEQTVDKARIKAHTDNIAGLIDRLDRLTNFVNGKPARMPEWPNVKPEQTTVAPPYASTSRVDRLVEHVAELRRELNLALANGHEETRQVNDRLDKLEDAVNWTDGANMENGHAPNYPANDPEPPVDTSWHPYDVETEYLIHPSGNTRIMTLARGLNVITGPWISGDLNWGEAGEATIVAWRYAKEGE